MSEATLRILMIEDSLADARLIQHELRQAGLAFEVERIDTEVEFAARLVTLPDVILCDFNLPQFSAARALEMLRDRSARVPFIIISGSIGEETAVEMMRLGATDYLLKDRLGRLGLAVRMAVEQHALFLAEEKSRAALEAGERRYRELADSIPQIVWTAGPDGNLDFLNARATEYTGMTLDQLTGWSWANVIHPDDIESIVVQWTEIVSSGLAKPLEFRIRRWDGEYHWHITRQVVSRGPDGRVLRWYGTSTDIHDQKVAEEALRDSESRFRLLVETIPHKMWMTDADGLTTFLNQRGIRHFGLSEEAIQGFGWLELLHPQDAAAARLSWEAAVASGHPFRSEYRMREATGEYRWYLSQGVPLPGPDGKPERWVGTWTDINEQKQAEEMVRVSGELLHAVSVNTTDAVFVKDRAGRYLLFNPAAARFVGLPMEEVLGQTDAHIFDESSAIRVMEKDQMVMTSGEPDTSEEVLTAAGVTRTYLVTKAPYRSPAGEIIGLVGISRDITQSRKVREELQLRDRAIMAVTQAIVITDPNLPDNPIVYVSPFFEKLTGYSSEEALGRNCRFLQGRDTDPAAVTQIRDAIRERRPLAIELLNYRKDGAPFWNGITIAPVMDGDRLVNFISAATDVTERRKLEEQFRQSQKMEAVGQLAGGIAHDFNNLLTIINGYSEMLLGDRSINDQARSTLAEIRTAGERAAGLTAQLLAFSRKTIIEPKILNLNDLVDSIGKMLRRLIGEDIRFTTNLETNLYRVKADPGLVEQALLNLAVNARDAMPRGGRLTIETRNVLTPAVSRPGAPPDRPTRRVRLVISDTGVGMTPEVLAKIFEPFFTTKGVGKGTGLGLATVYGIMQQCEGTIDVTSEPGRGTRFELLFPAVEDKSIPSALPGSASPVRGAETVLLVEDEDAVRKLSRMSLTLQGYTVLEATRGEEAIRLFDKHADKIRILVTDVVMPDIGGRVLADTLRARKPDLKVLFVSGYTNDAIVRHGISESTDSFLQKPFTPMLLARKVRAMLDAVN